MRPSDEAIVKVIAEHFGVSLDIAMLWITDIKAEQDNGTSA